MKSDNAVKREGAANFYNFYYNQVRYFNTKMDTTKPTEESQKSETTQAETE